MRWTLTIVPLLSCLVASSQFDGWKVRYYGTGETGISVGFTCVVEDIRGILWFGTQDGGLVHYDGYEWSHLQGNPRDTSGLPSNRIHALLSDPANDQVLVGTSNGVSIYRDGVWFANAISGATVLSLEIAQGSTYWAGTSDGLVWFNMSTGEMRRYRCPPSGAVPYNKSENAMICLLVDRNDPNLLWVGTQYGLKSFNVSTKEFAHHPNPPKWHSYLPEYEQYEMKDLVHFQGKLCLGAGASGGVICYDGTSWDQYLYRGGIPETRYFGNYVNTVLPIPDGPFIAGTTTIFAHVDVGLGELVALNGTEVAKLGPIRDIVRVRNGLIWLVGDYGVARLNTDIRAEPDLYPPLITRTLINGEPVQVPDDGVLAIPTDKINLSIQFASPNPVQEAPVRYRWRMPDLQKGWSSPTSEKTVHFSRMTAGQYQFNFECSQDLRTWVAGEPLVIEIRKPFMRKAWVIALMVAMALGATFGLVKLFSAPIKKRIRLTSEIERRTINAELMALRSQMNPHFIFNSLNSIYNFILGQDNEKAAEYLSKFAILMRMVLGNSQVKGVSLDSELSVIRLYLELEQIRFDEKFAFEIHTDLISDPGDIIIPPMLIQPYIENAIWHGFMHKEGTGKLTILMEQKSRYSLRVVVEDDGIGRERSSQHKPEGRASYGSSITEERLASFSTLYNAPFNVEIEDVLSPEGEVRGTRVVLDVYMMKSDMQ